MVPVLPLQIFDSNLWGTPMIVMSADLVQLSLSFCTQFFAVAYRGGEGRGGGEIGMVQTHWWNQFGTPTSAFAPHLPRFLPLFVYLQFQDRYLLLVSYLSLLVNECISPMKYICYWGHRLCDPCFHPIICISFQLELPPLPQTIFNTILLSTILRCF